ncbi:transposase [Streptomyces sp. NPDC047049]|uniref:transposase n=1 Tax=Streptomyces sp. NPDC047049 TaxID=3156688 RepID=UPI0033E6CB93
MPDTPAVLTGFTKQAGNHGGTGYPQVRLLALVACGTRTLIDAVFGPTASGETTYTPRLLPSLRPGMILLADRNFAARNLIADIAATGAEVLVRLKNGPDERACCQRTRHRHRRTPRHRMTSAHSLPSVPGTGDTLLDDLACA